MGTLLLAIVLAVSACTAVWSLLIGFFLLILGFWALAHILGAIFIGSLMLLVFCMSVVGVGAFKAIWKHIEIEKP